MIATENMSNRWRGDGWVGGRVRERGCTHEAPLIAHVFCQNNFNHKFNKNNNTWHSLNFQAYREKLT